MMKAKSNKALELDLDVVSIGSTIEICDLETNDRETYTLTLPAEADIRCNRISTFAPMGNAVYGCRVGDVVEVDAPGGVFRVRIEAIDHRPEPQLALAG
jgi:transcription elongation GreA/GreB family factor